MDSNNLIQVLNRIDKRLSTIEEYLKIPKNNNNTTITSNNSTLELIKYDMDSLVSMLNNYPVDEWSEKFLTQIIESKYDTVTKKQYDKLLEIARKVNYTGPLTQ